jgi:hypothetical protein
MSILFIFLMLLTPLVCGILLGFIQLAFYRICHRPADFTPSFPILIARGLLLFFILAAIMALVLHLRS